MSDEASATKTIGGTPGYQAPEVFKAYKKRMPKANYNAYKSDVFSLGLVLLYFSTTKQLDKQVNVKIYIQ